MPKTPTINPRDDRILIERPRVQGGQSKGGIALPDTTAQNKHKPQVVKILAIGPGKFSPDGARIPITHVKCGDRALVMPFAGDPLDDLLFGLKIDVPDGCLWSLVRAEDVLAVVE